MLELDCISAFLASRIPTVRPRPVLHRHPFFHTTRYSVMPSEVANSRDSEAVKLMKERLSGFETEQGRLAGLSYRPRANDIIITTTPKAGTTWMQQICHQLRSGGDVSFEEITEVVPWIEMAFDQGQDLEDPQFGHEKRLPRIFKTHAWEPYCPKAPKSIVVMRHPYDVLVSFYHFFEDWFFEPGTIALDTFAAEFWLARGVPRNKMENASYFHHLTSWFARKDDESVLIVFYEDLKEDLEGQIARVARFMSSVDHNLELNVPIAIRHSTFEFMRKHSSKFDERLSKLARNEACGLPKTAGMNKTKIRRGTSGAELSDELKAQVDNKWNEVVKPITGCDNYEQLKYCLSRHLNSS